MGASLRAAIASWLLVIQAFAIQNQPQPQPQTSTGSQAQDTAPAQAAPAAAAKPPLVGFGLEDGTPVKLRLTRNLSSGSDRKGDTVDFEVVEDVSVDDIVVIPRGGIAWATITEA